MKNNMRYNKQLCFTEIRPHWKLNTSVNELLVLQYHFQRNSDTIKFKKAFSACHRFLIILFPPSGNWSGA